VDTKQRSSERGRREQLLTLLNGWDPAGVLQAGGRRDAYESFVNELLGLLERDASRDEISEFLENETAARYGARPEGASQFATKIGSWYRMESEK